VLIIVVILIAAGGAYYFTVGRAPTSTPSTATTGGPSAAPTTLTYETANVPLSLDPSTSYESYGWNINQQVYENLLWYNGTCSTCVVPWLANSYTVSPDQKTYQFTLRQGIKFADGEPVDSTAVYFSFNRLLLLDGSSTTIHGGVAWIIQQLLNYDLSTTLAGKALKYDHNYLKAVLDQNFVEITGSNTFTLHLIHSDLAFQHLLAQPFSDIMAPDFVMQRDLAMWNQTSNGYNLPYPTLTGAAASDRISQYFQDLVATCDSGVTPTGCANTYLTMATGGSLAGSGPYTIQSFDPSTNNMVLQATPNYWGGPSGQIRPKIQTIQIKYVPSLQTRELDLFNSAKSGAAMQIDLPNDHLYDVADRNAWLNSRSLTSTVQGVSIYGPYPIFATTYDLFFTNVTNWVTGGYAKFQPFADIRMRLAFGDAVNMTEINLRINNNLGQVATSLIPPNLPPAGAYNPSIKSAFEYDPYKVQELLLDAMMHPITHFTFTNGSTAPPGVFDNTFGCSQLGTDGTCANPVAQSLNLVYYTGDSVGEAIVTQIATVVNNVSLTYNMGLQVTVSPLPIGPAIAAERASKLYMYSIGWWADYPWALNFLSIYAPHHYHGNWNFDIMGTLYNQALDASAKGDNTALMQAINNMNAEGNREARMVWQFYPENIYVFTTNGSNGLYFNPAVGGLYYASLS